MVCYLPKVSEMANHVGVLESEDVRVEQRQVDEDYRIFGERPVPLDSIDIGGAEAPIQKTAFHELIDNDTLAPEPEMSKPAMPGQFKLDDLLSGLVNTSTEPLNTENKSGTLVPLDIWLDKVPLYTHLGDDSVTDVTMPIEDNEHDSLECFRRIHIDEERDGCSITPNEPENARNLNEVAFSARIFYRNIRDRYPQIPEYLALRLSEANQRRAERLDLCKVNFVHLSSSSSESSEDSIHQFITTPAEAGVSQAGCSNVGAVASTLPKSTSLASLPGLLNAKSSPMENNPLAPKLSYWSGTYRLPGPHSSASGSSNVHSSLHGSAANGMGSLGRRSIRSFSTGKSPGSNKTHDVHAPLLSLPPPPVQLGTQESFTCDICGHEVEVLRRRDWK